MPRSLARATKCGKLCHKQQQRELRFRLPTIPWARHPDNGIENLVIADQRCNHNKRDFLAAGNHVEQWSKRLSAADGSVRRQLAKIAQRAGFDHHSEQTMNVARTIYSRLPDDVRLWLRSREFVAVAAERERLVKVLVL